MTRVGKNWHHPGQETPSVRRYDVPKRGRIQITGHVRKLHLDGDGIEAVVFHGSRAGWRTEIEGKDGTGVEPALKLDVRRGDRLRFAVGKRGNIYCDTTFWDPYPGRIFPSTS